MIKSNTIILFIAAVIIQMICVYKLSAQTTLGGDLPNLKIYVDAAKGKSIHLKVGIGQLHEYKSMSQDIKIIDYRLYWLNDLGRAFPMYYEINNPYYTLYAARESQQLGTFFICFCGIGSITENSRGVFKNFAPITQKDPTKMHVVDSPSSTGYATIKYIFKNLVKDNCTNISIDNYQDLYWGVIDNSHENREKFKEGLGENIPMRVIPRYLYILWNKANVPILPNAFEDFSTKTEMLFEDLRINIPVVFFDITDDRIQSTNMFNCIDMIIDNSNDIEKENLLFMVSNCYDRVLGRIGDINKMDDAITTFSEKPQLIRWELPKLFQESKKQIELEQNEYIYYVYYLLLSTSSYNEIRRYQDAFRDLLISADIQPEQVFIYIEAEDDLAIEPIQGCRIINISKN